MMGNELEVVRDQPPAVVEMSPMAMISAAVQRGVSAEELGKLMDLQQRHEASEARKAFVLALNNFKADPPAIFKNKQVAFGQGKTAYKHATLDNVSGAIGAKLAEVGISHRWDTEQLEGGLIRVTCVLTHAMGHSERTPLQASPDQSGSKNSIQAVGSTVTYLQRYTLLAATGMAVQDQDDDGRQGKRMSDDAVQQWEQSIATVPDEAAAAELWKQVAAACTASGDVEAYQSLQAAMLAKRKELKKGKGPI